MPKAAARRVRKPHPSVGHGQRGKDDVGTPKALLRAIEKEFGAYFDPCPLGGKQKAARNAAVDGLKRSWKSGDKWVFCNPPYSNPQPWIRKAVNEYNEDGVKSILLIPARVWNVYWFDNVLPNTNGVRILRRPLTFDGYTTQAPFGSALVFIGGKQQDRYAKGSMGPYEYITI